MKFSEKLSECSKFFPLLYMLGGSREIACPILKNKVHMDDEKGNHLSPAL